MTQRERRIFLIRYLLDEIEMYRGMDIPRSEKEQRIMLRGLLNIRPANAVSDEFLLVQDEYLKQAIAEKGITDIADLQSIRQMSGASSNNNPFDNNLYLWRGDITTLRIGAIVNAANSGMTGCWQPNHACIDNCIHTYAGVQLRLECDAIMRQQGFLEPTGQAKITGAYNLPSDYVIHTVGPIVSGELTQEHCRQLASCYRSCLDIACQNGITGIAFCCISTGVFCFPLKRAAEIAVETVRMWLSEHNCDMRVVFNVFSQNDEDIYRNVLHI